MRVDIKTVKGKHYLQFVDRYGLIHHIGPANDEESWLLSLYLWEEEWSKIRDEFLEKHQSRERRYIQLREGDLSMIQLHLHPDLLGDVYAEDLAKVEGKQKEFRRKHKIA